MEVDDYTPLNFIEGINHVTFLDDGRKYALKKNDDDIIVYLLKNGKYEEIGPFKDLIALGRLDIIYVSPVKNELKYISQMKNGDKITDIGYYDEINENLYIKLSDFNKKYGHIKNEYEAGGKRYKKSRRKYSNKKRKQRKYSNKKRRKH